MDADNDGITNRDEFYAGTDPNDPMSFFAIDTLIFNPGTWTLSWNNVIGKTYRVEYSGDLKAWFNFGALGDITTTESTINFSDPSSTLPASRFYRISIITP